MIHQESGVKKKKILYQGAEAIIYLGEYQGRASIIKHRIPKSYRPTELDIKLRKFRTRREAKILRKARTTISCPEIFRVDDRDMEIIMEYIDGLTLKKITEEASSLTMEINMLYTKLGENIGKLHSIGIIHGDLTTSNIIVRDNMLFFIDFGLGFFSDSIEDKATDMHLLERAIESTHYKWKKNLFDCVKKGYFLSSDVGESVFQRIEVIEKRRRYT